MHVNWFKDPDNVVYCKEEEVLPRLSKELGIGDLAERVAAFRAAPAAEGINLFPEPIEMGENVWIYMGELCPAYCLYTPWEDGEKK